MVSACLFRLLFILSSTFFVFLTQYESSALFLEDVPSKTYLHPFVYSADQLKHLLIHLLVCRLQCLAQDSFKRVFPSGI